MKTRNEELSHLIDWTIDFEEFDVVKMLGPRQMESEFYFSQLGRSYSVQVPTLLDTTR